MDNNRMPSISRPVKGMVTIRRKGGRKSTDIHYSPRRGVGVGRLNVDKMKMSSHTVAFHNGPLKSKPVSRVWRVKSNDSGAKVSISHHSVNGQHAGIAAAAGGITHHYRGARSENKHPRRQNG